ncbi:MAG: hypothetical protein P1U42_09620 [Phycisphaerales bacterium]|nr:hypothetical protein [Phycisphaerales bacterium]
MKIEKKTILRNVSYLFVIAVFTGCELQQRRVEVREASGADESLDSRFELTGDAQDPTEKDAQLGYGRWKAKPETTGTDAPTDPDRRGSWTGSP